MLRAMNHTNAQLQPAVNNHKLPQSKGVTNCALVSRRSRACSGRHLKRVACKSQPESGLENHAVVVKIKGKKQRKATIARLAEKERDHHTGAEVPTMT